MKEAESMIENKENIDTIIVHQEMCDVLKLDELFYKFNGWQGQRYIFVSKDQSEWLFGAGIYAELKEANCEPDVVSRQFKTLLSHTEVTGIDGNLIRLFGGFQFDEGTNAEFEGFGHSHFIWPKVQVLFKEGRCTVTMTDMTAEEQQQIRLLLNSSVHLKEQPVDLAAAENIDAAQFMTNVNTAVQAMADGAFDKVVLARRKRLRFNAPVDLNTLVNRAVNSHDYSYFMLFEQGEKTYISRTPEQLVKVSGHELMTNAIAGTMSTADADAHHQLLNDEKNLKEHKIVVDSIYDDLKPYLRHLKVGRTGLLKNRYFYHLYTQITGVVDPDTTDVLQLSCAMHPTPALGGYPKQQAAQFIQQMEGNRGFYGAPIGYIDAAFDGEFIVAIRSMLLTGNEAVLYAGCGVVQESTAEAELTETEIKFKPMLQLLGVTL